MTCIGFEVLSPDRAIAWADTETYAENIPSGNAVKLFANPLARTVFVGSGRMGVLREAADAFNHFLTFEQALERLPRVLAQAERSFNETEIAARAPLPPGTVAVVGFSRDYGLAGAVFAGLNDWHPAGPVRSFASPRLPNDSEHDFGDEQGVIAAASAQLQEVQRHVPGASGGALVVAEIAPAGIRAGPVFDLGAGKMIRIGWRPDHVRC